MSEKSWDGEQQEETGCKQPAGPVLCTNKCGFFGTTVTMNLCSKCYRALLLKIKNDAVAQSSTASLLGDKGLLTANQEEKSIPIRTLLGENGFYTPLEGEIPNLAGGEEEADLEHCIIVTHNFEIVHVIERSRRRKASWDPWACFGKAEEMRSVPTEGSSNMIFGQKGESHVDSALQENEQNLPTPNRCLTCRKRVGLTGFKCRCGDIFCALHRYSDKHNCTFDYKAAAREAIARANPVVKAEKIEKI